MSRADWVLKAGPGGDDREACEFWQNPPAWIVTGNTPDEALAALVCASAD